MCESFRLEDLKTVPGEFGNGKIFITNIEEVIRVRTGETGAQAI